MCSSGDRHEKGVPTTLSQLCGRALPSGVSGEEVVSFDIDRLGVILAEMIESEGY